MDFKKMSQNKENKIDRKKHKSKRKLTNYVAESRDFQVKKGLFQRGLCTSHFERAQGPAAGKFARLNGDLNKIIGFANNKASSTVTKHSLTRCKAKNDLVEENRQPYGNKTSFNNIHSSETQNAPKEQPINVAREKSTSPVQNNKFIRSHNLENYSSVTEVKKARTAEFVNSLPSFINNADDAADENVGNANLVSQLPTTSEKKKCLEAQMQSCYNEHISSLSFAILGIKDKRFPHISYNQSLKNTLVREFHENFASSSSTDFSESKSVTHKIPDHSKNVPLRANVFAAKEEFPSSFSPSKVLSSPPLPSPPMFGSPDLKCTDFLPSSQSILHNFDRQPPYPCFKIPAANQMFHPAIPTREQFQSTCFKMTDVNKVYHPAQLPQQNRAQPYNTLETSSFVPYKENVVQQTMCQRSNPSLPQSSLSPNFKFYPRNMF